MHKLGARKVALFGLGLLGYTPVELATCSTNGSSCVENIDNAVELFNDRLVSLVDDFNTSLPNATFIFINTTQISLNSSSAEGNITCSNLSTLFTSFTYFILPIVPKV